MKMAIREVAPAVEAEHGRARAAPVRATLAHVARQGRREFVGTGVCWGAPWCEPRLDANKLEWPSLSDSS